MSTRTKREEQLRRLNKVARLADERALFDQLYREAVRQAVEECKVAQVARAAGVTRQTVYNIMREERKP